MFKRSLPVAEDCVNAHSNDLYRVEEREVLPEEVDAVIRSHSLHV